MSLLERIYSQEMYNQHPKASITMDDKDKMRLQKNHAFLVDNLKVVDIVDSLLDHGVLEQDDHEALSQILMSHAYAAEELLRLLPQRGAGAFSGLCESLRTCHYPATARRLENTEVTEADLVALLPHPDRRSARVTPRGNGKELERQSELMLKLQNEIGEEVKQQYDLTPGLVEDIEKKIESEGVTEVNMVAYLKLVLFLQDADLESDGSESDKSSVFEEEIVAVVARGRTPKPTPGHQEVLHVSARDGRENGKNHGNNTGTNAKKFHVGIVKLCGLIQLYLPCIRDIDIGEPRSNDDSPPQKKPVILEKASSDAGPKTDFKCDENKVQDHTTPDVSDTSGNSDVDSVNEDVIEVTELRDSRRFGHRFVEAKEPDCESTDSLSELVDDLGDERSISAAQDRYHAGIVMSLGSDVVLNNVRTEVNPFNVQASGNRVKQALRRATSQLLQTHWKLFRRYVGFFDEVNHTNSYGALVNILEAMGGDGEFSWGRLVAIFAIGVCVGNQIERKDLKIHFGEFLGFYIWHHHRGWIQDHGGWEEFASIFSEDRSFSEHSWETMLNVEAVVAKFIVRQVYRSLPGAISLS